MQIDVLLFATLKDLAGTGKLKISLSDGDATVKDVRQALIEQLDRRFEGEEVTH